MICDCGERMYCTDTRPDDKGTRTRRRYKCQKCDNRITTFEIEAGELEDLMSSHAKAAFKQAVVDAVKRAIANIK